MSGHGVCNNSSSRNDSEVTNNGCFNNNSNNISNNNNHNHNHNINNNNYIDEELSLKFELDTRNKNRKKEEDAESEENENENEKNDVEKEEKESSNDLRLSYCRGLSRTPLAVPMVADTLQNSVTRNDAKAITETRLKRLKELSGRPEEQLSTDQKDEKKRIIRLEKNRRAAAMSRRKKKMYVKGLEEKYNLMARHLAILEMENSHLRAILNASHHNQHPPNITNITNIPHFKIPNISHFQIPNIPNIMPNIMSNNNVTNVQSCTNSVNNSCSVNNNNTNSSTSIDSMEENTQNHNHNNHNNSPEPVLKRRKLNDGSCLNITPSLSCDNSSDISTLEPLPISQNIIAPPSTRTLPQFNIHHRHLLPPNIANIHPSRLISYPHHVLPQFNIPRNSLNAKINNNNNNNEKNEKQTESKAIEIEDRNNNDNDNNNDIPPEIVVPRLSNEYLSILDDHDDIIDETVDECGSVIAFQQEIKQNNVYL